MSFTEAWTATRSANSGRAASSMGTATPPRSRMPQKAMSHSAELGAHSRTRSLARTSRDFRRMANSADFSQDGFVGEGLPAIAVRVDYGDIAGVVREVSEEGQEIFAGHGFVRRMSPAVLIVRRGRQTSAQGRTSRTPRRRPAAMAERGRPHFRPDRRYLLHGGCRFAGLTWSRKACGMILGCSVTMVERLTGAHRQECLCY